MIEIFRLEEETVQTGHHIQPDQQVEVAGQCGDDFDGSVLKRSQVARHQRQGDEPRCL